MTAKPKKESAPKKPSPLKDTPLKKARRILKDLSERKPPMSFEELESLFPKYRKLFESLKDALPASVYTEAKKALVETYLENGADSLKEELIDIAGILAAETVFPTLDQGNATFGPMNAAGISGRKTGCFSGAAAIPAFGTLGARPRSAEKSPTILQASNRVSDIVKALDEDLKHTMESILVLESALMPVSRVGSMNSMGLGAVGCDGRVENNEKLPELVAGIESSAESLAQIRVKIQLLKMRIDNLTTNLRIV